MPNSRLYKPGGGTGPAGPAGPAGPPGPPGTSLDLYDEGVLVAAGISSLDIQGADIEASSPGAGQGVLSSPPPPPPAFGYWAGGSLSVSGTRTNLNDRMAFNTDSVAMLARGVLSGNSNTSGANSGVKGYFAQGEVANAPVDALLFATDAIAMLQVNTIPGIVGAFAGGCGAVNSSLLAYFAGFANVGSTGNNSTRSLDFAVDTNALVAKGVLTNAKQTLAGCGSSLFGYFAGGQSGVVTFADCDKLDYSNDALAMTAAGALTTGVARLAAANSTTFGYFCGGATNFPVGGLVVTNNRLDFAADGVAMVAKGSLSVAGAYLEGCNSTLKAYFASIVDNLPGFNALVTSNALTFATDTAAMVTRGAMTTARGGAGACQSGGIL